LNSKLILLLGGLVSSFIVYTCLQNKYLDNKKSIQQQVVTNPKKSSILTKPVVKEKPVLYFMYGKDISARLNFIDKNLGHLIVIICKEYKCLNEVIYSEEFTPAKWSQLATKSLNIFTKNHIKNSYIKAVGDAIEIKADFTDKKLFEEFNKIIRKYQSNSLKITNNSKLLEKKNNSSIQDIQKNINSSLEINPIYFASSSDELTAKGLRNLNKIVKKFKKFKNLNFDLTVEGHTDSKGNNSYNLKLSQKRADRVKKYLTSHLQNLNYVTAKGYGSTKPKYKDSKNPKNRRVEIVIKRGFLW